jgi:hypothetical protein
MGCVNIFFLVFINHDDLIPTLCLFSSYIWMYVCVYVKVLTFGGMMTAYLVSCYMSLSTIGVLHGVSSIIGLLGAVVFAQSQKYHMT